jgi:hypothetical protein
MWEYEWRELGKGYAEILVRTRDEDALDGMTKTRFEVLALLTAEFKTQPVNHLEWTANLLWADLGTNPFHVSMDLFEARVTVEKYFRQLPEEGNGSPLGGL